MTLIPHYSNIHVDRSITALQLKTASGKAWMAIQSEVGREGQSNLLLIN